MLILAFTTWCQLGLCKAFTDSAPFDLHNNPMVYELPPFTDKATQDSVTELSNLVPGDERAPRPGFIFWLLSSALSAPQSGLRSGPVTAWPSPGTAHQTFGLGLLIGPPPPQTPEAEFL